jgi:hypothetical protein
MPEIHQPARLVTRAASFRYGGRHHPGIPGGIIPLYPGGFVGIRTLAYNLGNFMRTLAMPKTAEPWSLTSLREKLIKIGAKVVICGRPSMASTFLALRTIWLAAVICPASVGAEHMSAGPDEVR